MAAKVVNKQELIKDISKRSGLTQKDTDKFLHAYVDSVIESLSKGDKVQLIGFGTFETRDRAARAGRNPQTGEELTISATTVPAFKAGKAFKDAVK